MKYNSLRKYLVNAVAEKVLVMVTLDPSSDRAPAELDQTTVGSACVVAPQIKVKRVPPTTA